MEGAVKEDVTRQLGESLKQNRDAKEMQTYRKHNNHQQTPQTQSMNLFEALSGLLERY